MSRTTSPLWISALLGVGCLAAPDAVVDAPGVSTDAPPSAAPKPTVPQAGVTYREHVAPILAKHCASCHSAGGIAPFAFEDYASAARYAALIANSTADRRMPPYYADNSGDCRTHRDANWLSDAQIATLAAWAADPSHPEGDVSVALPTPPAPRALERVDATIDLGMSYTPAADDGAGDYDEIRCFLVDPGLPADRIVTGYRVLPGAPSVVHHVIVFGLEEDSTAAARALEAQDERPGWRCDGGSGLEGAPVVVWAPGVGATRFPEGTGLRLAGRRSVVLQMHYNFSTGPVPDRTRVELELEASVPAEARLISIGARDLALEPGQPEVTTRATFPVPQRGFIWGVLPHMHQRGLGMTLDVSDTPSGAECLLETVRWDFHWQQPYFYDAPIQALPGGRLSISCRFDTSRDASTIRWGEKTTDEMCLSYLYVTPRTPPAN